MRGIRSGMSDKTPLDETIDNVLGDEAPDSDGSGSDAPDELTITVEGYDATRAMQFIAQQVMHQTKQLTQNAVDEAVAKALESVTKERIEVRIDAEIDRCLTEGFQPTTEWGEAKGPRVTLKQRIEQALQAKVRVDYDKPPETVIEVVTRKKLEEVFRKEFDAVIAEAKAKFKALVEGEQLKRMRDAFGSVVSGR